MEALLPKGNSGSVGVEDELIVSLMSLVYYQLIILQSVGQRFLIQLFTYFCLFSSATIFPAICTSPLKKSQASSPT
ncbi:MAG: hypothetical protein RL549_403 [Verrucomicrobiota bacterium]|jgi:hypothetical protein